MKRSASPWKLCREVNTFSGCKYIPVGSIAGLRKSQESVMYRGCDISAKSRLNLLSAVDSLP